MDLSKIRTAIYYVTSAIVIIGTTAMYALTPVVGDDLWYTVTVGDAEGLEAMKRVWSEICRHWYFDTGRLANIMNLPFLTVIPKWVFGILCGALMWVVIRMSRSLIQASPCSMRAMIMVFGIAIILPWLDNMYSVVFALNYFWTGAMTLVSVIFMFRTMRGWKPRPFVFYAGIVVCIFAGWMHEGFSVPVLCGIPVYWLLSGREKSWRALMPAGAFAMGAFLIFVSPAFRNSLSDAIPCIKGFSRMDAFLSITVFNCCYYIFILIMAITFAVRKIRQRLLSDSLSLAVLMFILISTTVSTVIFITYYDGPRMGWYSQLFCCIGILICARFYPMRLYQIWGVVWSVVICGFIAVNFIASISKQSELRDEYHAVVNLYGASPDGKVFYDIIPRCADITLMKPTYQFYNGVSSPYFSTRYGAGKPEIVLLPTDLKFVDPRELKMAKSDASICIYRNRILATDTAGYSQKPVHMLHIVTDNGLSFDSRCGSVKFTDITGITYVWLVPHILEINPAIRVRDAALVMN